MIFVFFFGFPRKNQVNLWSFYFDLVSLLTGLIYHLAFSEGVVTGDTYTRSPS